jgi:hypothetical protein
MSAYVWKKKYGKLGQRRDRELEPAQFDANR